MTELALRDYQREAIDSIEQLRASEQLQRMLVSLPTGTGKTVVFAHILHERASAFTGHGVVLVHRDELVLQAVEKIRTVSGGALRVGIVKGSDNQLAGEVVVASIQTLSRERRMAQAAAHWRETGGVHTVVVDEAHHSEADTWRAVLEGLGSFTAGGPLTLGFTATPERADGRALGNTWQRVAYQRPILDMIENDYLCDIRGIRVSLPSLDLNAVKKTHGDYAGGDLSDALLNADAPEHIVRAWMEHAEGRKTLVFTPTVAMAQAVAAEFDAARISAEYVSGETPIDARRFLLSSFSQGRIKILSNAMLLTEGYDEPSIECIIVARPTRSHALYVQQVGRGTRKYPGKADLLVLDVVGATAEHRLVTLIDLVGSDAQGHPVMPAEGESILEAVERGAQERLAAERLVAEAVDLFRENDRRAREISVKFRWVPMDGQRFVLGLGEEALVIRPNSGAPGVGAWALIKRSADGGRMTFEPLYAADDFGYVQGVAEDYARQHKGSILAAADAPWRRGEPSGKQLGLLARNGIKVWAGITKGQASDLITAAIEANRWR